MATELSLVSEKRSPSSGALLSSITPPGDAAYCWYSRVREDALARDVGQCTGKCVLPTPHLISRLIVTDATSEGGALRSLYAPVSESA